ncbi:MAG TPA: FkbM family methyltransferase [Rhodobacteraceae bacterium]|nr:FkbM family methyltransferase [Paracoccaceae bacterium]
MSDVKSPPQYIRSRGIRMPNNPKFITQKQRRLLRTGNYEIKEFEAIMKIVRPEDTVIEIGAGIGFMSTVIAKRKGAKKVVAVEANPGLIPHIKAVHEANDVSNVEVINAVLGPRKGPPVNFYVRGEFSASSLEDNVGDKHGGIVSTEKVEVMNINTLFKDLKPTILVCDIEGAEANLLPATDLSCLRAAVVELHPQWIGQDGIQAVFDAMHKAGLTYFPRLSQSKVVTFKKDW